MHNTCNNRLLAALALAGFSSATLAEGGFTDELSKAVTEGSVKLDFRYRFEYVDQENFDKDAEASTLRSRITFESGKVSGFSALAEIDNVTVIGSERYNSTVNGNTEYPVVADPKGTNINQVYLKWAGEAADATYGRQRINLSNQRFVGGVAWRQNEQTFDGVRANWKATDSFSLDYSYTYKVHRIFGPDEGANPPNLRGANHFLYLNFKPGENHTLGGFAYLLDFDPNKNYDDAKTTDLSSDTVGIEYIGKFKPLSVRAAYARQSDAGDSNKSYDADYYLIDLSAKVGPVGIRGGYEVLGAGDGTGFATPLATLHKFQGWADQFLSTPGDGIEDLYIDISGKVGPVKLGAIYHDFRAEDSSEKFGKELDLVASWPVNKHFSTQLKFATFSSDSDRYQDTDKVWLTLQLKL